MGCQVDEHEGKRQRTGPTSFIPIPSSSLVSLSLSPTQLSLPTQSQPCPRPRPRPCPKKPLPPAYNTENVGTIPPNPASPTFPPFAGFYTHEAQPQFMPPPQQDILFPYPSWGTVPNAYHPYIQNTMLSPYHQPHPSSHDYISSQQGPGINGMEFTPPPHYGPNNQYGRNTFYCELFSPCVLLTNLTDVTQNTLDCE